MTHMLSSLANGKVILVLEVGPAGKAAKTDSSFVLSIVISVPFCMPLP